ncbi:MAG: DUF3892 domain-containing protein [Verrucomicrobia bacterium]|nr:DUF3892 domain-containing protein [Verrucomicrobiota bacterium]
MATRVEVNCINRTDRHDPYERINAIGGGFPGHQWTHPHELAIRWIEDGTFEYYMEKGMYEFRLIVAISHYGHKYLKTSADGDQPDNLLSLPECP